MGLEQSKGHTIGPGECANGALEMARRRGEVYMFFGEPVASYDAVVVSRLPSAEGSRYHVKRKGSYGRWYESILEYPKTVSFHDGQWISVYGGICNGATNDVPTKSKTGIVVALYAGDRREASKLVANCKTR